MATGNNNINASMNLTDLDFHGLKNSFKNYLRRQQQFKDYDYDGSSMAILLEELAYNSYKNAFFSNMIHSEGFIDSAQLRTSLFSHSKELNYLPRSTRSARARVRITFEAEGTSQPYVVQKGSQFSTLIKSKSYTFSVPETITVASANTTFQFETDLYEGVYIKDSYVYMSGNNQRFKITNKNVDTRSIAVTIFEDGSQTGDIYKMTSTLLDLTENSKVFFLQTSETGNYEIYFGDDVLGRQPKLNSTILIDYRISNGTAGNGARVFSVDFDPTGSNELQDTPYVDVIEASKNGNEAEDNESIRYYAPRAFQVQERTVTPSDYEIVLKSEFPEINAVSVYGGEEVDPPRFGKVFVSIDISDVEGLPESKKTSYYNFIKRRAPLSIDAIIIEPERLYLSIYSLVRYNLNITTNSINRIKTLVTSAILDYNTQFLNDFASTLRISQLSRYVDDSDLSIVSNQTVANVYKKWNPTTNTLLSTVIYLDIPLMDNLPTQSAVYSSEDQKTVYSSFFKYNGEICKIEDDSNGVLRIVKFSSDQRVTVKDVGTVDYATGKITINNIIVNEYDGDAIKIFGVPADKDITARKNIIMKLEPAEISVEVQALYL